MESYLFREVEADADDQVAVVGDHRLDVGPEVGVRGGFSRIDLDSQVGVSSLQAVVRGLIKGLVVPSAGV